MTIIVNEVFYSIQGESSWSGLPFVFIRLAGCNLRCRYCDTTYAYEEGSAWKIDAISELVRTFDCPRVALTGGEPLLQDQTPALVTRLLDQGYMVSMETNGSLDIGRVDRHCIKIMDLKAPSSGMQQHNRWANLSLLSPSDQVKIVIADRIDFDFALRARADIGQRVPSHQILFSPAHGRLPPGRLAEWMLDGHVDARLQIQLHKYIWPGVDRGV